jgi:hypothetical protein
MTGGSFLPSPWEHTPLWDTESDLKLVTFNVCLSPQITDGHVFSSVLLEISENVQNGQNGIHFVFFGNTLGPNFAHCRKENRRN